MGVNAQDGDAGFSWRTSSYSTQAGGNCVEVGWHVSRYSDSGGGSCVEAGRVAGEARVAVRDTKDRARGSFTVSHAAWTAFVRGVVR